MIYRTTLTVSRLTDVILAICGIVHMTVDSSQQQMKTFPSGRSDDRISSVA